MTPLNVLIVEDNPDEAELLVIELESMGYDVTYERVDRPLDMSSALDRCAWDVILCDYSMPHFSASRALRLMQEKQLDLPFIIVSGNIGEETAVTMMKVGAHDYLMKDRLARLAPAVERELREAVVRAERRHALERLQYQAYYDSLTGLANRERLLEAIKTYIQQQTEHPDKQFAVLFVDTNRYKTVKYGLGHKIAEQLLVAIARRLQSCLSEGDLIARVGSDEFAIVLPNIQAITDAEAIAQQIYTTMLSPLRLENSVILTSTSIGIVSSILGYDQPEDYLRAADTAMHTAKTSVKSGFRLFDVSMQVNTQQRLELETDLQQAICAGQLMLHYQPILSLATGQVSGFEALVRWQHPEKGFISPGKFIPIAEETGLIVQLGEWVLREACQQMKQLVEQVPHNKLTVNVNLSGLQLEAPNLLKMIEQTLEEAGLGCDRLKLEITESVLMEDAERAIALLKTIKSKNIRVCMDDFGTGYSSLGYLRELPIDVLKIDRSFVNGVEVDSKSYDIFQSVMQLAKAMELVVVAEGVETAEQATTLRKLGCDLGQGYYFARPMNFPAVLAWTQKMLASTDPVAHSVSPR